MEESLCIGYIMDPEINNQLPAVQYLSTLPVEYDRRALASLNHNSCRDDISPLDIDDDNKKVASVNELWIFATDTFNPDLREGNYIYERAKHSGTPIKLLKIIDGDMRECTNICWIYGERGECSPVYNSGLQNEGKR